MFAVTNDAVPTEVDQKPNHMEPAVVKQEPDDVCFVICAIFKQQQLPQMPSNKSNFSNCVI